MTYDPEVCKILDYNDHVLFNIVELIPFELFPNRLQKYLPALLSKPDYIKYSMYSATLDVYVIIHHETGAAPFKLAPGTARLKLAQVDQSLHLSTNSSGLFLQTSTF